MPETNASPKLFVFRTTMENATQSVRPANPATSAAKGKIIPNELIVRLKPGAKIDELAKLLGAKVIGRIDSLNAYRLQFEDQAAADAARQQLATNPDVASVDSNYSIDRPAGSRPGRNAPNARRRRSCSSSRRPATVASSSAWWIPPCSRWATAWTASC